MYTVTLTFADAQMAADAISDLLNNHRQATISLVLDEMISSDHPEYVPTAADRAFSTEMLDSLDRPMTGGHVPMPRDLRDENLTAKERKIRDRMREAGQDARSIMDELTHRRYVDSARKTPEYKAYVDRQRRKSVLRLRRIQQIIDRVSCETCNVVNGAPCRSAGGKAYTTFVHRARERAAEAS